MPKKRNRFSAVIWILFVLYLFFFAPQFCSNMAELDASTTGVQTQTSVSSPQSPTGTTGAQSQSPASSPSDDAPTILSTDEG